MKTKRTGGSKSNSSAVSPAQETAITLMVQGRTLQDAAAGAGVNRTTLFRWMRHDPVFVAAWNGWRRDQHQAARAQVMGMTGEAVTALRDAIAAGDGKLAFAVLKGMGIVALDPAGSDDPVVIKREMELAKRKETVELTKGESDVAMEEMFAKG